MSSIEHFANSKVMAQSFRFRQQMQLCESILTIKKKETFSAVLTDIIKVLIVDFNLVKTQRYFVKLFLQNKRRVSNGTLEHLLQIVHNTKGNNADNDDQTVIATRDDVASRDHNYNSMNNYKDTDNYDYNYGPRVCLSDMTVDVFNKIGSYLELKSSLRLSRCNRMYNAMILSVDYFNKCEDTRQLKLTKDKIYKIMKENSCLDYYLPNCRVLSINCDHDLFKKRCFRYQQMHGVDCRNEQQRCVLCNMFIKLNRSQKNSNSNSNPHSCGNYDIRWIESILSQIDHLMVDNLWSCAFSNLPFDNLLGNKSNTSDDGIMISTDTTVKTRKVDSCDKDNYDFSNIDENRSEIRIQGIEPDIELNENAMRVFGNKYDGLYRDMANINYDCIDDPSESFQETIMIRRVGVIFDHGAYNSFTFLDQLHCNYDSMYLNIPYRNCNHRFISIEHFLQIFHNKVDWFEPTFGKITDDNNKDDLTNVPKWLFCDSELINDLNKSETNLSFNDLLKKYHINDNQLPNVKSFLINSNLNGYNALTCFLNHNKLIKLLNLEKTVDTIILNIDFDYEMIELKQCLRLLTNMKFNNLLRLEMALFENKKQILNSKQFYIHDLIDIFIHCLQNFENIKCIAIRWINNVNRQEKHYHIKIENKHCIFKSNLIETNLVPAIVSQTKQCENGSVFNKTADEIFHFDRVYQV